MVFLRSKSQNNLTFFIVNTEIDKHYFIEEAQTSCTNIYSYTF